MNHHEDGRDYGDEDDGSKRKEHLFAGSQSRFVDYTFGNVQTQNLEVTGNLILSGIAMGNPLDGGAITVPSGCSTVILQNTTPYTHLTINLPLEPQYGQLLSVLCTVNVATVTWNGGIFGTTAPAALVAGTPVRFVFAGSWFNS